MSMLAYSTAGVNKSLAGAYTFRMRTIGIPELLVIGSAMAFVALLVIVVVWAVFRGKRV
jgi:hypothetical protein